MRWFLAALTLQAVYCLDLNAPEWISFKARYNKTYGTPAEEALRLKIFTANLRRIELHGTRGSSFQLGVNALADLTVLEYRTLLTAAGPAVGDAAPIAVLPTSTAGGSKDWRDDGAVTSVKSMGSSCGGASWAFAAAAAVESAWQIVGHPLVKLSEQQLIDCSRDYGTAGCESGLPQQAFEYLVHADGLSSASDYPYRQQDGGECGALRPLGRLTYWLRTTRSSEAELEYVVANIGPVAARVDASHSSFQLYSGGVYDHVPCSTSDLSLAVTIVGYGTETVNGQPAAYWLVKNAWGPGWGEYGYMKIRKDASNMCGIATDVTYPVV